MFQTATSALRRFTCLSACAAILLLLNGCAALAVSLAGAGAGAGITHQVNGTAMRTFSAPRNAVDAATTATTKRLQIDVDTVESIERGSLTRGQVGGLAISIEVETLSDALTRVTVTARRNLLRLDGATALEIVTQIDRSLATLAKAARTGEGRYSPASSTTPARKQISRSSKAGSI